MRDREESSAVVVDELGVRVLAPVVPHDVGEVTVGVVSVGTLHILLGVGFEVHVLSVRHAHHEV